MRRGIQVEDERRSPKVNRENAGGKRPWSLSARLRLIVACLIAVILLSFSVSIYLYARKERMDYAVRESESLLNSLSNNITSEIERYKALSRLIMMDEELVTFLRANSEDVNEGLVNNAIFGIRNILNVTENVDSVFVFREDMKYLSTNRGAYMFDHERMETDDWLEQIWRSRGRVVISVNGNNAIFKTKGMPVVTIGRAVYDLLTQHRTGIMMMNISDAMLEQTIRATKNDNVCIVDTDGKFLAGNESLVKYFSPDLVVDKPLHKTETTENGRLLASGYKIPEMPLIILCSSEIDEKIVPFGMGYVMIFLLVIFVAAAFLVGAFITRNITGPVFELTSAMEKNRQEGKLERISVAMPRNEIGMLEDSYNNMIDHVNELIKRLIEKEKTLQKAEMRVLHEQIKPHFLYNSLETIGFLALDAGADSVYSALETLGSFYRNFLSKGDREIPLKREINIVQDYLSLQKLRYGDVIEDEYDIAEDTKECIIPKLILQPLVENSIYHGIRLKGEPGSIRITSRMEEGVLHVLVRDTGVGMSRQQIDKIMEAPRENGESGGGDPSESFGLWGTIERIRCFCDRDDVVRIRSEAGEYTEVEFLICPRESGGEAQPEEKPEEKSGGEAQPEEKAEEKSGGEPQPEEKAEEKSGWESQPKEKAEKKSGGEPQPEEKTERKSGQEAKDAGKV